MLFWEHEGNRAVRDGNWKLVAKGADGPVGAVRHGSRPHRACTISSKDQPDRVKAMADAWQQWAEKSQVLPLNPRQVTLKSGAE